MATGFELQVLQELGEIKSTMSATAQQVASLEDRLFNGGSGVIHTIQQDIEEMKSDHAEEKKMQTIHNWLHYSISPLIIIGHAIARKFGVNI